MDYKKLGLKAGIEIHQRLKTRKLFCDCDSSMGEEKPILMIERKLRAVAGELGEVDRAALFEYLRNRTFHYQIFKGETCLVETDEEPPHPMNKEALKTALEIALLLNCKIVDEIHVMRKTVIDGSNTSGFQRTALIGMNGWIEGPNGKKVGITQICLEEESAGIVEKRGDEVVYRLDRLAIPLVEISTSLLVDFTPEEIQEIAYKIGMLLRSTGKVMRGIGTIRQDVNVSIARGARVEIKGVQELGLIQKIIENEVKRQLSLLEIRDELKKRGVTKIVSKIHDVTDIFKGTKCKFIKKIVDNGGKVFSIVLKGFAGLLKKELCPGKTLGREFADYAVAYGVKGIIHSDEDLKKYSLESEFNEIRRKLSVNNNDSIIIIAEREDTAKKALEAVLERARECLIRVPEETRVANPDGTTSFTRPLPGGARLYPETDLVPIKVSKELIEKIRERLPEPIEVRVKRLEKMGIRSDIARDLLLSDYEDVFNQFKDKIHPPFLAHVLVGLIRSVERETKKHMKKEKVIEILDALVKGKIVKEAVEELMVELAKHPEEGIKDAIEKLGLKKISDEELVKIIKKKIVENKEVLERAGDRARDILIGMVMREVRGRIGGELVVKKVRELLER